MSDYSAHEGLEHAEKAFEHLEGESRPVFRAVPLVAAVLAVLAGLSSLYGNRLAEKMLSQGNEAILSQTQAADTWNEYEADSLKAHVAASIGSIAATPAMQKRFHDAEQLYRKRQKPLGEEARRLESEVKAAIERMNGAEAKKLDFDVGTALFQISIVLASISAMTRRSPLFFVGLIGGAIGIVYCVIGLVR